MPATLGSSDGGVQSRPLLSRKIQSQDFVKIKHLVICWVPHYANQQHYGAHQPKSGKGDTNVYRLLWYSACVNGFKIHQLQLLETYQVSVSLINNQVNIPLPKFHWQNLWSSKMLGISKNTTQNVDPQRNVLVAFLTPHAWFPRLPLRWSWLWISIKMKCPILSCRTDRG